MIELIIICVIVGGGFFFQQKYKPTAIKDSDTAYVLWIFSIFGLLGFHRHYLGKYGTGCLWMFTCGCFGIGAFVDLLTLINQVNNHNNKLNKNLFPINQNHNVNTQINFQATTYNQTTAHKIKPLHTHDAKKNEQPIKQELASDIKTVNRTQTALQAIEVIEESSIINISNRSSSIQPEEKKIEQTENVVISEDIPSEIEISKIYDTEAEIKQNLSREVGKITKLSGKIGNGELKLYIASADWKKLPLSFLPTLSFEFELDNKYNFVIVHSSNKTIASLKKGDSLKICFEDGNFIEKKFGAGRNLNGKSVHNIISLTDLELKTLSENIVKGIENIGVLKIPYEFTEINNEQYANSAEGKQLLKIICQKLVEIKMNLKNNDSGQPLPQSVIGVTDKIVDKSTSINNASSSPIENTHKEIAAVIQSLTDSKQVDTIEPVSENTDDNPLIDVTDEIIGNSISINAISSNIIQNTDKKIGSVIKSISNSRKVDTTEKVYEISKDDSVIDVKDEIVSNSISTDAISSITIEKTDQEIGSVIESLINSKKSDSIEPVSEIAEDNSIIDITDETYIIKADTDLIKYMPGVPYWPHQYVYSFSELINASPSQKQFYFRFKNSFLTGTFYDLEGNNNYCFILLFNLLDEYDGHKSMTLLEKNLDILGTYYPKTKSYAASFLRAKKNVNISNTDSSSFTGEDRYSDHSSFIDYDTFNWRNKYKKSLNLSEGDITLLNKIWYPSNNFTSIEYCCKEIIKLYIVTINKLQEAFKADEAILEEELFGIADLVVRKHYGYRTGSQSYKYAIEPATNELYNTIFKYCENSVRETYGHKRKINTALRYSNDEVKTAFESKIVLKLDTILPTLITSIKPPDDATELELNTQNTVRWKSKFAEITTNFSGNAEAFVETIIALGNTNKNNPSVENIFFEASKFIAKQSKEAALKLYVYYLHYDLKSATFDNKQLTKTVQKSLFNTNEQLHTFEQIISELINDKNLDKALNAVSNVYAVKRKKIQLDRTTIKEVQQLHSGTVELLNEYLRDDFEDDNNTIKAEEINTEEIQIEITQKTETAHHSIYLSELPFTTEHISVLELFSKNSLSILQSEMEEFAKSKGIFKNQIIESINETCYETLDDVLIEEDDDYYTILPEYYNKIKAL